MFFCLFEWQILRRTFVLYSSIQQVSHRSIEFWFSIIFLLPIFAYLLLFLTFLSNIDCDIAEDTNGVVNPEDGKEGVEKSDKMDEGWLFTCLEVVGYVFYHALFLCFILWENKYHQCHECGIIVLSRRIAGLCRFSFSCFFVLIFKL